MKYERIIAEFYGRAWALPEDLLLRMHQLLSIQASGVKWSEEEIRERIADANARSGFQLREHAGVNLLAGSERRGGPNSGGKFVAVIPIVGIISHRMSMVSEISGSGGTSIQKVQGQLREALRAEDISAIVLDVDSPGGSVDGVMELASEIYNARKQKPITAVCNSMACSAAYWLASAAGEVVITPSGQCGSIGVYMLHQDESKALEKDGIKITIIKAGKYKTEGSPSEPLSQEAYDAFLDKVNDYYGMFVKAVAQHRGVSQTAVRNGYGQGRSLLANDAVKQNLADRVGTLDDILGKTVGRRQRNEGGRSELRAGCQPGIHRRRLELDLEIMKMGLPISAADSATKPGDEEDGDDDACGCDCVACQRCEAKGSESKALDDANCHCACDDCKACSYKSGAVAHNPSLQMRRRQLDLDSASAGQTSRGRDSSASLQRRQHELDLMKL
jgi:signal peptide peptidase SppA